MNKQKIKNALKSKSNKTPHLIVVVEAGCLRSIISIDGKEYRNYSLIDYDNAANGICPVCQSEVGYNEKNHAFCSECGYIENNGDDNALQCAIARVKAGQA